MTAPPSANFDFLREFDAHVARLAFQAETYVHTDPESCLFKLRLMVETMARRLVEMQRPDLVSADLARMLKTLEHEGLLPRRRADVMHAIRRDGNAAVHGRSMPAPTAARRLRDAHALAGWFCKMIRRGASVKLGPFTLPPRKPPASARARRALAKAEALEEQIEERRYQTREALLLFGDDFDTRRDVKRLTEELEALEQVSFAAGEPLVDSESVALIMAMDIERLFSHPRLGMSSRDAQHAAEQQLDDVKHQLEEREEAYEAQRALLAGEAEEEE